MTDLQTMVKVALSRVEAAIKSAKAAKMQKNEIAGQVADALSHRSLRENVEEHGAKVLTWYKGAALGVMDPSEPCCFEELPETEELKNKPQHMQEHFQRPMRSASWGKVSVLCTMKPKEISSQ